MPNVVEASDFIESISDVSEYSVSFKSQPDFTKEGKQEVIIYISDEHKNSVELRANLTIIKDTNPPVIEGLEDKVVFVGDSISYRQGVVVTDDIDSEVELTINSRLTLTTR